MRGLEYDDDPNFDRWQGIFHDRLEPYTGADESFDFDSSRDFEDVDEHLIDGSANWPKFNNSNTVEDSAENNDAEEDSGSCRGRCPTFMPNSSWPDPAGVNEGDHFSDEDIMLKDRVDIVSMPPFILEGGYVDVMCPEYEKMALI